MYTLQIVHSLQRKKKNDCNEKRIMVRNSIMDWGITRKEGLMDLGASLESPFKVQGVPQSDFAFLLQIPGFGPYGVMRR